MIINLPLLDVSFTVTRHELVKAVFMYIIIHLLVWLYMHLNGIIRWLVAIERDKIERQVRTKIIKYHVYNRHPHKLQECLIDDCAMLTSSDI